MKTSPEYKHVKEQVLINRKIEEMLSVLEERKKLMAEFYKSFLMTDEKVSEPDVKEQDEAVSP